METAVDRIFALGYCMERDHKIFFTMPDYAFTQIKVQKENFEGGYKDRR